MSNVDNLIAQIESKLEELKAEVSLQRNSVLGSSFSLVYTTNPTKTEPKPDFADLGSKEIEDDNIANPVDYASEPDLFPSIPEMPDDYGEMFGCDNLGDMDDCGVDESVPAKPKLNLKDISVFVTGDTTWPDYESVRRRLDKVHKKFNIIKLNHAGTMGVETFACRWARLQGILTYCNQPRAGHKPDIKRTTELINMSDLVCILTEGGNDFVSLVIGICKELDKPYKVAYAKPIRRNNGKNNDKGNISCS
jgi:hypothetical protein